MTYDYSSSFLITSLKLDNILSSVSVSTLERLSSSINTEESFIIALAIDTLCFDLPKELLLFPRAPSQIYLGILLYCHILQQFLKHYKLNLHYIFLLLQRKKQYYL